jgi:hypothetical protein
MEVAVGTLMREGDLPTVTSTTVVARERFVSDSASGSDVVSPEACAGAAHGPLPAVDADAAPPNVIVDSPESFAMAPERVCKPFGVVQHY